MKITANDTKVMGSQHTFQKHNLSFLPERKKNKEKKEEESNPLATIKSWSIPPNYFSCNLIKRPQLYGLIQ